MAKVPSNYLSCCSGHFVNLLQGYTSGCTSGLNLTADLGPSPGLVLLALSLISNLHVVLKPEVLDMFAESLERVLTQQRDLVLVHVQRPELVDRPQRRRRELLDQVRRHR